MATPPDFASGAVLTAAQMNAIGLWEIKSQTVGSAVSTVTVTDAFSADYRNYFITYTGGTLSSAALITCYMGATTGTAYYEGRSAIVATGAAGSTAASNQPLWTYFGYGTTTTSTLSMFLYNPQAADRTYAWGPAIIDTGVNTTMGINVGTLENTTQYTSFTLDPAGAVTMTGGVIRVYGFRN